MLGTGTVTHIIEVAYDYVTEGGQESVPYSYKMIVFIINGLSELVITRATVEAKEAFEYDGITVSGSRTR